jgi:hypothetical protein
MTTLNEASRRFKPNAIDPREWGKLEWIPVRDLSVPDNGGPEDYQRKQHALVEKIGANFKPSAFGALIVVRRKDQEDRLEVADGGNRLRAVMLRNQHATNRPNIAIAKLPAYVVTVNSAAEAAEVFDWVNTLRKSLLFPEAHNARLIAENEHNVATQKYRDELHEQGVEFYAHELLDRLYRSTGSREILKSLRPLFVKIAQAHRTHPLSRTVMSVLVRIERDLQPEASLTSDKYSKILVDRGYEKLDELLRGFGRSDKLNDDDLAKCLQRSLRIRPARRRIRREDLDAA